jgi:hypothetical protein
VTLPYHVLYSCTPWDGVTNGGIHPRMNEADSWKLATSSENYAIRINLAETLELFLGPVVARTKKLPESAKPVVLLWQQHRRPGPQRFEDFVMPLLNKRDLARITDESMRHSTAAEREELETHQEKFVQHFLANEMLRTWSLSDAELHEFGIPVRSTPRDFIGVWVKTEKLLQRHIQMAAHMRLLYKLGGEYPDLAYLWSTEVNIQTDLGRFIGSAQAYCVGSLTMDRIHRPNSSYFLGIEHSSRFFPTTNIE